MSANKQDKKPETKSPPAAAPKQRRDEREEVFGYHAGEVIQGKYELVRVLGRGGMAAVWAVQNLILDAQFALKMLSNEGKETHADERMLREARAAAAIEHPAIIKVFDFGITPRGDPFIVMELLLGETVKDMLVARRRFSPIEAVRLMLPVADALAVAHARGVVHRDIKPDNIVCVKDDVGRIQPKIVDFGIAKRIESDWERITQFGTVIGTPEYLSPEQAKDEPNIDQRSDIWAFSAVLYEMLTGRTPFYRENVPAILQAIIEEPVVPLARYGVQESELSALILRGLHKFPQARWEDMRSYGRALAQWLVRRGIEEDVTAQSVRVTWLGASPSAPPVAIDKFPEVRPPRAPGLPKHMLPHDFQPPRIQPAPVHPARAAAKAYPHLPGFEDAYEVPKKGILQTATGIGLASIVLSAIVGTGLFVAGVFDPRLPSQPLAEQPLVAAANAAPADPESVPAPPATESEPAASTDAGALDSGFTEDAGIADAKPDVIIRRPPRTRPPARPTPRRSTPPAAAAEPKAKSAEPSTSLPEVKPPPDLDESANAIERDDPYKYRNSTNGSAGSTGSSSKSAAPDKPKRNWGY